METLWSDLLEDLLEGKYSDEGLNLHVECQNINISINTSRTEQICNVDASVSNGQFEVGATSEGGVNVGYVHEFITDKVKAFGLNSNLIFDTSHLGLSTTGYKFLSTLCLNDDFVLQSTILKIPGELKDEEGDLSNETKIIIDGGYNLERVKFSS